jgi:trehalose-phosphatase
VSGDTGLVSALDRFAQRDAVLVALDFDGTLSPIVDEPDAAAPLPRAAEAVRRLVGSPGTAVAIVSGRALDGLRAVLGSVGPVALVGSHGAELEVPDGFADGTDPDAESGLGEEARELLARLHDDMTEIVGRHPGTALEEKPASVVLHTRRADRPAALAATAEALLGPARRPGVHVLTGKEVVELAVTEATKGAALRRLRSRLGLAEGGVLYAGDDTTDELAFRVLDDGSGDLTLKIGSGPTAARHRVAGPDELADVLTELAQRRQ